MLEDLNSGREIARITERLLREAGAGASLPTPVEDIIAAAELKEPEESWLSESALKGVPDYLAAKMRKLRFKTEALLDRKEREIHISPDVEHDGRRRFKQVHEVTHDILPWQQDTAYADDSLTLSWATNVRFEQEANQGGAELLFQRDLFAVMAADYKIGFAGVLELADKFGASYHASFRRYVEAHRAPMAGFVLEPSPCTTDPLAYRRKEAVTSKSWTKRFGHASAFPRVIADPPYGFVKGIRTLGTIPSPAVLAYPDINNETADLQVELWSNSYRVFVLMWVPQRERLRRRRVVVPSSAAR
jgi:Zn-dependent peptidase ImmA (M78 family)